MDPMSPPSIAANLPLTQRNQLVSRLLAVQPCPDGPPFTSSFKIMRDNPYPVPGSNEVCIRTRAVGLNHIDWKNMEHQIMVKQWPEILGFEIAGVIEAVGTDVKESELRVGQAVFGLSGPVGMRPGPPDRSPGPGMGRPDEEAGDKKTTVIKGQMRGGLAEAVKERAEDSDKEREKNGYWIGRAGGFQEVTCVPKSWVTRKPESWLFDWAAGVPLVYMTACSAVVCGLGIQLPFLTSNKPAFNDNTALPNTKSATPKSTYVPKNESGISSVLVLGGSSGVGGSAIQLLRMALGPEAIIITTSNNPDYSRGFQERGATAHIRGELDGLSEKVRIITGGMGVDAILDCISAAASLINGLEDEHKDRKENANHETHHEKVMDQLGADTGKVTIKDEEGETQERANSMEVWDVFRVLGPKLYVEVATGRKTDVPGDRGIKAKQVFSRMIMMQPGGERVLQALPDLIESGKFQFPHPGGVKVVGKGLKSIPQGLEQLREGSGGVKFVVRL